MKIKIFLTVVVFYFFLSKDLFAQSADIYLEAISKTKEALPEFADEFDGTEGDFSPGLFMFFLLVSCQVDYVC